MQKQIGFFRFHDWAEGQPWADPNDPDHIIIKFARIEAAFAYTGMPNLVVDLGAKIWLPLEIKDAVKISNGVDLGLGVTFRADAFSVLAMLNANFGASMQMHGDDKKFTNGLNMKLGLIPAYDLDFATLGLSIAFEMQGEDKYDGKGAENNWSQFGIGGFVQKGLGSGNVKAGFAFTAPMSNKDGAQGSSVFTIPIILEYAFF